MSVHRYETADGTRWRVRWRTTDGKLQSKTLASRREADALDGDIKARKLRADVLPQPSRWTLARAWDEWWAAVGEDLAPATQLNYAATWKAYIAGRLDHHSLVSLVSDPKLIEDHFADLRREGVGPAARRKAMMVLSGVLTTCVRWKRIPLNPVRDLKKPSAKPTLIPRPFAPLAIERLRQRMLLRTKRPRAQVPRGDACLISLMSYGGLRPQECLALTFGDIGNRLSIDKAVRFGPKGVPSLGPTKTKKARTVPLEPALREDLEEWRQAMGNPSDSSLVFPEPNTGGYWSRHTMSNWRRRVWHPALDVLPGDVDAAQPPVASDPDGAQPPVARARLYDCRGSFVSLHLRAGASPLDVAQWAGHSPTVMYNHYAAVIEELEGEPRLKAEEQIRRARQIVDEESEEKVQDLISETLKSPKDAAPASKNLLYGPRKPLRRKSRKRPR